MSKNSPGFKIMRIIQKLFVSVFVICSFVVYAVHERLMNPDNNVAPVAASENASTNDQVVSLLRASPTAPLGAMASTPTVPIRTSNPAPAPTQAARLSPTTLAAPTVIAKSTGAYRDGSYTGGTVNAYWGMVQVKATVQNGKITDVQFLQYPKDRRTSQYINTQVMPWLQTEAIKAQNANVDVISGATLTSEAFIRSLQTALNTAKN